MRNMLALVGLMVVIFLGVGYYRDWFSISVDSDKNFNLKGNGSKVLKDVRDGAEIGVDKLKDISDNLKKDKDSTPVPTPATIVGPPSR